MAKLTLCIEWGLGGYIAWELSVWQAFRNARTNHNIANNCSPVWLDVAYWIAKLFRFHITRNFTRASFGKQQRHEIEFLAFIHRSNIFTNRIQTRCVWVELSIWLRCEMVGIAIVAVAVDACRCCWGFYAVLFFGIKWQLEIAQTVLIVTQIKSKPRRERERNWYVECAWNWIRYFMRWRCKWARETNATDMATTHQTNQIQQHMPEKRKQMLLMKRNMQFLVLTTNIRLNFTFPHT